MQNLSKTIESQSYFSCEKVEDYLKKVAGMVDKELEIAEQFVFDLKYASSGGGSGESFVGESFVSSLCGRGRKKRDISGLESSFGNVVQTSSCAKCKNGGVSEKKAKERLARGRIAKKRRQRKGKSGQDKLEALASHTLVEEGNNEDIVSTCEMSTSQKKSWDWEFAMHDMM